MSIKEFTSCCLYNISIAVLALIFMSYGLYNNLIEYHHNILVLLLWYVMMIEMSKLIITMLVVKDAPIMIRYIIAGLIISAGIHLNEAMITRNQDWVIIYLISIFVLLGLRYLAIKSTKEGR